LSILKDNYAVMVSLQLDTPELAAQYDVIGQRQFSHGQSLIQENG
jgi:hypothetical protein